MAKSSFPFTPNEAANALLKRDGTALLIGMCLDQQVRTEKAFSSPYELRQRIGHVDARKIAAMTPARLDSVFRKPPALHRFPGMMARRVRALCKIIASEYGNRGANVWMRGKTADDLFARLRALPGFGESKAASGVYVLAKYGGVRPAGWRRYANEQALPWEFKSGKKVI